MIQLRLVLADGTPHYCPARNAVHVFSTDFWVRLVEVCPNVYHQEVFYDGGFIGGKRS